MSIAFVSGYWVLEKNKYAHGFYEQNFKHTLAIRDAPVYMFCDDESKKVIEAYGSDNFSYINKRISDFVVNTYPNVSELQLNDTHVPSRELGMIWLEKIHMVQDVKNMTQHKWFCWTDAGNAFLRDMDISKCTWSPRLEQLDKTKLHYTVSQPQYYPNFNPLKGQHCISGTAWILHRSMIDIFVELFKVYYCKLSNVTNNNYYALSDQLIWSYLYRDYPELFKCVGVGYGTVIKLLYLDSV